MEKYLLALLGGVMIGGASLIASAATGKIPGISGLFGRLFLFRPGDTVWRLVFLLGLIAGAAAVFAIFHPGYHPVASLPVAAVAGLLVGLGTRLGGGCTSGHGICGIGLGTKDSFVATLAFMAVGMITVFLVRHVFGGPIP